MQKSQPCQLSHIPSATASALYALIGLTATQCDTILQLISLAENGCTSWWKNYNYIEALHDGRGYTVTLFGACSGTGDLYQIIQAVQKLSPSHPLVKYLPALKLCRGDNIHTITGLAKDIPALGNDEVWRQAVWTVYISMYWAFASHFAAKTGPCTMRPGPVLSSAVGCGFMLDTAINHGGDMPSFQPIISRMANAHSQDEKAWLNDFMLTRKQLLKSGFQDLDTSKSGDRCVLWKALVDTNNMSLARPVTYIKGYWNGGGTIA
jgi:hypothetical protein